MAEQQNEGPDCFICLSNDPGGVYAISPCGHKACVTCWNKIKPVTRNIIAPGFIPGSDLSTNKWLCPYCHQELNLDFFLPLIDRSQLITYENKHFIEEYIEREIEKVSEQDIKILDSYFHDLPRQFKQKDMENIIRQFHIARTIIDVEINLSDRLIFDCSTHIILDYYDNYPDEYKLIFSDQFLTRIIFTKQNILIKKTRRLLDQICSKYRDDCSKDTLCKAENAVTKKRCRAQATKSTGLCTRHNKLVKDGKEVKILDIPEGTDGIKDICDKFVKLLDPDMSFRAFVS